MSKPIDVATRATTTFIASHVPSGAALLEVGCGDGHVALELQNRGYRVVGLDSSEDAVARAQERGVSAVKASWPEFESAPVDAVAFTRSLHHIDPLHGAVARARELLQPKGMLLLDDFAFDEANPATIDWFVRTLRSQTANALLMPRPGEFVTDLLGAGDPVAAWHHRSHDHDIHSIAAMTRTIAEFFTPGEIGRAAYLYRYLIPVLPETSEAATFVGEVAREEARLGARGEIVLIGRRLVATSRPAG